MMKSSPVAAPLKLGVLLVCSLLWAGVRPAFADDSHWRTVVTPRFTLLSETSERSAQNWADSFNQFIDDLGQEIRVNERLLSPLTIVIFTSEAEFDRYKPVLQNGAQYQDVAGFAGVRIEGTTVALLDQDYSEQTRRLIQEDCAYWFQSGLNYWRPLALQTGTAEVFSTVHRLQTHVKYGETISGYVTFLQHEPMMPVAKLLALRSYDPLVASDDDHLFHAEAWAFCHYLMFSRELAGKHALGHLWLAFKQGLAPSAALVSVLGPEGAAKIDASLRAYVEQGSYSLYQVPAKGPDLSAGSARSADLPAVEAALASVALVGNPALARAHCDAAIKAAPDSPAGYEVLASCLYHERGNPHDWLAASNEAVQRGSKNPAILYLAAEGRMEVATGSQPINPDEAREIVNLAESAINRRPSLQAAFDLLARGLWVPGRTTAEDSKYLQFGRSRYPEDRWLILGQAALARKAGDQVGADHLTKEASADGGGPVPPPELANVRRFIARQSGEYSLVQIDRLIQSKDYQGALAAIEQMTPKAQTPNDQGALIGRDQQIREAIAPPGPLQRIAEYHLLTARFGAAAAASGDSIYVTGGNGSHGPLGDIECFDLPSGRSKRLAIPVKARAYACAAVAGDNLLIFGGRGERPVMGEMEICNLSSGKVTTGAPMPHPRFNAASVAWGGKIYVIGGSTVEGTAAVRSNLMEIYDPARDRWTEGAPMSEPKESRAVVVGGAMVVPGGFGASASTSKVEAFDFASGRWQHWPDLCTPMSGGTVGTLNGQVYLLSSFYAPSLVVAYNPQGGASQIVKLAFTGAGFSAAVTHRGMIYLIGGRGRELSDAIQVLGPAVP
jgi:hypothetical protein